MLCAWRIRARLLFRLRVLEAAFSNKVHFPTECIFQWRHLMTKSIAWRIALTAAAFASVAGTLSAASGPERSLAGIPIFAPGSEVTRKFGNPSRILVGGSLGGHGRDGSFGGQPRRGRLSWRRGRRLSGCRRGRLSLALPGAAVPPLKAALAARAGRSLSGGPSSVNGGGWQSRCVGLLPGFQGVPTGGGYPGGGRRLSRWRGWLPRRRPALSRQRPTGVRPTRAGGMVPGKARGDPGL